VIGPDEPDVFFSIWCNGTRAPCHEKELSTAAANVATPLGLKQATNKYSLISDSSKTHKQKMPAGSKNGDH